MFFVASCESRRIYHTEPQRDFLVFSDRIIGNKPLVHGRELLQVSQGMRTARCASCFPAEGQACRVFLEPPMILPLQARVTEYHYFSQISQFFYDTPIKLHAVFPSGFSGSCAVIPCSEQRELNRTARFFWFTLRLSTHGDGQNS